MTCNHRVAKYQEANPGVYTIVTFPFLFAVMFGDWGHGICLLLATLVFIFREKKLSGQVISLLNYFLIFCLAIFLFYFSSIQLSLCFVIKLQFYKLQKLGDITEMTFGGRYVILMMALFSIYTGLVYNEFFSVPFELFGRSAYACRDLSCRYLT